MSLPNDISSKMKMIETELFNLDHSYPDLDESIEHVTEIVKLCLRLLGDLHEEKGYEDTI